MNKMKKMLAVMLALVMVLTVIPMTAKSVDVKGASFSITSPTNEGLVAAGYIDINWSAATGGKVNNYTVYINGQEKATVTDTSYEYYTTKVQMHTVYVKANYQGGTSESTDTISFGVSKKGLGLAQDMGANLDLEAMGVAWYYNWGENPSSGKQYTNIEYVPMVWKETNANNFKNRVQSAKNKGYKYILTFNEPDLQGQCDMPVNSVYNVWKGINNMEGINVSSPVTALWPEASSNWFQPFMKLIDDNGDYKPDFISIHCYADNFGGTGYADWFLTTVVDWAWEKYGLPIWVTEFSTTGSSITADSTRAFWERVMPGLDSREYVERYAAFGFNSSKTGLWLYSTGKLTPAGEVYAAQGNPEGYKLPEEVEYNYEISTATRNTLLPDTITVNNVTCEDYTKKTGVSITASSQINDASSADNILDEDIGSRWESVQKEDPQYVVIDLGQTRSIKQVGIIWESASASKYTVQVSDDGVNYTEVALSSGGGNAQNRYDSILFKQMVSGRYVKIHGTERSTDYGYSIYDMAIYGTDDEGANETTPEAPTELEEITPSENIKLENSLLNNAKWTLYIGSNAGWNTGADGTLRESQGVVYGKFTSTGGAWDETIYGIQAQVNDVAVVPGGEYTYSATITATKDMTVRFKITDSKAQAESRLVYETIGLKKGQTYTFSTTITAPSNEIDIVWALGGGTEGATTDVAFVIASNNLIKVGGAEAPTDAPTKEPIVETTTPEESTVGTVETTTSEDEYIASMKKPRKVTIKKITKKKVSAKKVSLKIKKVAGATGYELAVYKSKKKATKDEDAKKAIIVKDSKKVKIAAKSSIFVNKKKLFVKVRAYVKLKSGTKVYGKWSKIKKVKIK